MPLIEFQSVSLGYGRNVVLRDVNFEVQNGDLLGIVGPNGTGKTTLLKGMLGLLRPQSGRIVFATEARQRRIGYVPQRATLDDLFPLTALDVALMGRVALAGVGRRLGARDVGQARAMLALAGLEGVDETPFRALSGGQKQRVLMARALATEAELLVLDEPTEGMDLPSEAALIALIRRLNAERGITVVLVSHLLHMVANTVSRLGLLTDGQLRLGPTSEMFTSESLAGAYGIEARVTVIDGRRFIVPRAE